MDGGSRIAALLRQYRSAAGLTQEELAEVAGVAVRTVRNLERGEVARPHRRTIEELADGLRLAGAERAGLLAAVGAAARANRPAGCLPPDVTDFTGRRAELDRIVGAAEHEPGVTIVVHGSPGIGKTSLVIHAAHLLVDRFGGEAHLVDLRGMDAPPLSTDDALDQLLTALGDRGGRLTSGERLALYRMLTARRRGLLVLDNAGHEAQVQPLLPTGPGWLVLVSSRQALGGLAGVRRVRLDLLSADEAGDLVAGIVDADRTAAEPAAVAELVRLCGRLPLALRIAGNRLAARPTWTVGALAEGLRDEQRRLDLLHSGDLQVRSAFAVSYRQLPASARRVLRRLALLGWPEYPVAAVAVLADTGPAAAEDILDALTDAGLLSPAGTSGRYVVHDLTAVFLAERLAAEDGGTERERACARVRGWLLDMVTEAGRWLDPDREPDGQLAGRFGSGEEAVAWLTANKHGWWWAIRQAAASDRHQEVIDAALALYWYSDRYHLAGPWAELFDLAVAAAQALDDQAAEAAQRNALGWALTVTLDRPKEGLEQYRQALVLGTSAGQTRTVGWSHTFLGGVYLRVGDPDSAAEHCARAIELLAESGDWMGRLVATFVLADTRRQLGDADHAVILLRGALADYPPGRFAHRHLAGWIRLRLGAAYTDLCRWTEAARTLEDAIADFTAAGAPDGVGKAHLRLAEVLLRTGDPRTREVLHQAVEAFRDSNDVAMLDRAEQLLRQLS